MSVVSRIRDGFLKIFGDIKVFKWPMFVVYDPGSYRVKGEDMREVIKIVKPGDILLRGYTNYLDGFFIPGYFSHAGMYVGKVRKKDAAHVPEDKREEFFRSGDQMVIHSMAEGVFMEDVLNFCRCDRMAIVRLPEELAATVELSENDVPFDTFNDDEKTIFEDLKAGKTLEWKIVWPVLYLNALSRLGSRYDFGFNFKNFNNLSCTEFVYFCMKSLESIHQMKPRRKKFWMYETSIIAPDAFLQSNFIPVWQSRSVKPADLERIKIQ